MAAAKTLTTKDIEAVFGVTTMTVHNWRKGSAKRPALPTLTGPGVRFDAKVVERWAKKNNVFVADPERLGGIRAAAEALTSKPGPKPRAPNAKTA